MLKKIQFYYDKFKFSSEILCLFNKHTCGADIRFISSNLVWRGASDGLLFFKASNKKEVHCWTRLNSMNTSTIWKKKSNKEFQNLKTIHTILNHFIVILTNNFSVTLYSILKLKMKINFNSENLSSIQLNSNSLRLDALTWYGIAHYQLVLSFYHI